jgi:hypothetical protein
MGEMRETTDRRGWKKDILCFEGGGLCVGVQFSRGGEMCGMK